MPSVPTWTSARWVSTIAILMQPASTLPDLTFVHARRAISATEKHFVNALVSKIASMVVALAHLISSANVSWAGRDQIVKKIADVLGIRPVIKESGHAIIVKI